MQRIISKVIEIDKEMRIKVNKFEKERDKLPAFLREQRKLLTIKYSKEAKKKIEDRESEIKAALEEANNKAKKHKEKILEELAVYYEKNHEGWVNNIYNEIIDDFLEE